MVSSMAIVALYARPVTPSPPVKVVFVRPFAAVCAEHGDALLDDALHAGFAAGFNPNRCAIAADAIVLFVSAAPAWARKRGREIDADIAAFERGDH